VPLSWIAPHHLCTPADSTTPCTLSLPFHRANPGQLKSSTSNRLLDFPPVASTKSLIPTLREPSSPPAPLPTPRPPHHQAPHTTAAPLHRSATLTQEATGSHFPRSRPTHPNSTPGSDPAEILDSILTSAPPIQRGDTPSQAKPRPPPPLPSHRPRVTSYFYFYFIFSPSTASCLPRRDNIALLHNSHQLQACSCPKEKKGSKQDTQ